MLNSQSEEVTLTRTRAKPVHVFVPDLAGGDVIDNATISVTADS